MTANLNSFRAKVRQLFLICNQLRESTSRVNQTISEVYQISLRSGISSSHVETGKRAFNEIAKQIARSSKVMEMESLLIRKIGTQISNLSLECLKRSLQIRKIYEAELLGCGKNTATVQRTIKKMEAAVFEHVDEIETLCFKTEGLSEKIAQQAERLWSLAINLRMEAAQSGDEEEIFFSNIGNAVAAAGEKLKEQQNEYRKLIRHCGEIRAELKSYQGEYYHAA